MGLPTEAPGQQPGGTPWQEQGGEEREEVSRMRDTRESMSSGFTVWGVLLGVDEAGRGRDGPDPVRMIPDYWVTTRVPVIVGWMAQWYAYVPGFENESAPLVVPGLRVPVPKPPLLGCPPP